uniref:Uncharacterized protein n=1 Tax=Tetranychus urticae TaxID=32264 RepID=T1JXM6_TETUR
MAVLVHTDKLDETGANHLSQSVD